MLEQSPVVKPTRVLNGREFGVPGPNDERTPLVTKAWVGVAGGNHTELEIRVENETVVQTTHGMSTLLACAPSVAVPADWPVSFDQAHQFLVRQEVTDESYQRLHAVGLEQGWTPEFILRRVGEREETPAATRPRFFSTDDLGLMDETPPSKEELQTFAWVGGGGGDLARRRRARALSMQLSRKPSAQRFREGYSNWRAGRSKGAKGEFASALSGVAVGGDQLESHGDRTMVGTYDRQRLMQQLDSGMAEFRRFQERQPSFKVIEPEGTVAAVPPEGGRTADEVRVLGSSFMQTMFNSLNAQVGLSLFALPYAMAHMGWVFIPCSVFIAVVARVTMSLGDRLQRDLGCVSFPDMASAAFGRPGRILSGVVAYVDLFLWALLSFIAASTAMRGVVNTWYNLAYDLDEPDAPPLLGDLGATVLCLAMFLPTCILNDMACLSYVSASGVFAMAGTLAITLFHVCATTEWSDLESRLAPTAVMEPGWALRTGALLYQFAMNAIFPSIRASMAQPQHSMMVVDMSLATIVVLLNVTATACYMAFGSAVPPAVNEILNGTPAGIVVNALVLCMTFTKYPLYTYPVTAALVELLEQTKSDPKPKPATPKGAGGTEDFESFELALQSPLKSLLVRMILLFLVFFLSLNCGGFVAVVEFAGWLVAPALMVVMPTAFFLKIYWDDISQAQRLFLLVLALAFSVAAGLGFLSQF